MCLQFDRIAGVMKWMEKPLKHSCLSFLRADSAGEQRTDLLQLKVLALQCAITAY